jgi:MFS transporter, DHA1 family, tetracycline resistance protein
MLDSMGIGLIMPVMPDLIIDLGGETLSNAAIWGGTLTATFAVMQFICGPTVGNLSDRFGRRPVLLVSLVVMSLDYLVMGIAGAMWILVIGRIVGGITSATQSTANAYIADISSPDKKAQNFGMIGAAFGVGFVLGPVVGGFLGEFGPRTPFFAAAILAAANAVFGYLILPETVTDKIRRPFSWSRANPFGAFQQVRKLPELSRLLIVFFFHNVAFFTYPSVWAYYTRESFAWDAAMVGISLGCFGLGSAIVQGGLMRLIIPRLGEHNTVLVGLAITAMAFLGYAFAFEGWHIFALLPLSASGIIAGPALQGIMSRTARDDQQGELQGVLTSVGALGTIISPLLMTNVFGLFTKPDAPIYFPGAPFVLSMVLILISLFIFSGRKRLNPPS